MADFVRRIVSGQKARFKDGELHLDLDLSYITDNVIVMGYPATGLEGLYRNRREDAQKFLAHRHGTNFWVFNFCPVRENTYDAAVFGGRMSRYPFPDHHAPPLALLPLVAREMRLWLDGAPERVAVLHCKAGKGRSGTLACAYLLSLNAPPSAPRLERNYTKKEWARHTALAHPTLQAPDAAAPAATQKAWAKDRAEELMDRMPGDQGTMGTETAADTDADEASVRAAAQPPPDLVERVSERLEGVKAEDHGQAARVESPAALSTDAPATPVLATAASRSTTSSSALANVLNLHTSRRMRPRPSSNSSSSTSSPDKESEADAPPARGPPPKKGRQGVSIPSQRRWLYYWSLLLAGEGPAGFWPALPHPPTSPAHDPPPAPERVRVREVRVRMAEQTGVRIGVIKAASRVLDRAGRRPAPAGPTELWASLARYDDALVETLERWERWGRAPGVGGIGRRREGGDAMVPAAAADGAAAESIQEVFADGRWDAQKMVRSFASLGVVAGEEKREGKVVTATLGAKETGGVIIDAHREVRFKIYMGKVFLCWFWLIPAFHMAEGEGEGEGGVVTVRLKREDLDFAVGLGAALIEVEVALERVPAGAASEPPARALSGESEVGQAQGKGGGVVEAAAGILEGAVGVREGVEVQQGLED